MSSFLGRAALAALAFVPLLVAPAAALERLDLFSSAPSPRTATRGTTFARLGPDALDRLRGARQARIPLATAAGDLTLALERTEPFAPGATIAGTDGDGSHAFDPRIVCLRGAVEGEPGSTAVLTVGPRGAMGFIEARGRRWAVAPVADGLHRIADESEQPALALPACGVPDAPAGAKALARAAVAAVPNGNRYLCDLAIDCDYELYTEFGSDLALAMQYVTTVIANISLIYERDIDTSIRLSYLNVWTTSADPYTQTTAAAARDQFLAYWNINRQNVPRTIAFLVSGKTFSGFQGFAYIDVLCEPALHGTGFAVASVHGTAVLPNNVTSRDVWLIAHEMGHQFGSWHTQSCNWSSLGLVPSGALIDSCYAAEGACYTGPTGILPPDKGTIMSYCDQLPNFGGAIGNDRLAFHPICAGVMRAAVEASCMSVAPTPPPRDVVASAAGTATRLTWNPPLVSDATHYDVYRSTWQTDPAPALVGTTAGTTFDDPAPPWATLYYRVRGVGPSGPTAWSREVAFHRCPMLETGRYPSGANPLTMASGDFNGDGHLDLAVINGGIGLSVLLGDGAGHLSAPTPYIGGTSPVAIVAADLNDDDILDLAVSYIGSNQLGLHLGQGSGGVGDGTFAPPVMLSPGAGPNGLVAGDFNEDGIPDLAVLLSTGRALVTLLGQGTPGAADGTFVPADTLTGLGFNPRELALTEVNGDGIADLVGTVNAGPFVMLGNGSDGKGDGTFGFGVTMDAGHVPIGLAIGDLDGDGVTDVAAGSVLDAPQIPYFATFLGNGTGGVGNGTFGLAHRYATTPWDAHLTIDDWTQDGLADLAVAAYYPTSGALIYPGIGGGALGGATHYVTGGAETRALLSADFDHDGLADLAASNNTTGTISIFVAGCPRELANGATLIVPDGSEVMEIGTEQTIAWTRDPGCMAVTLRISRDGGATWRTLAKNVAGSSYRWTVTGPATTAARIQVANASVASAGDASDADFTIASPLVATTLALASRDVAPGRVALRWQGIGAGALSATVERRGDESPWQALGDAERLAEDRLGFVDVSVAPGERWGYRLSWIEDGERQATAEEWIEVPGSAAFALEGATPNPAAAGALRVGFSLPDAAPATLELLDLAGRRIAGREVGSSGPGRHLVTIEVSDAAPAGVYWLRLRQGGREERRRAVLVR